MSSPWHRYHYHFSDTKAIATLLYVLIVCIASIPTSATQLDGFWSSTFENHGTAMLLVDTETGAIVRANKAAAHFYGYSQQELQQMGVNDINQLPAAQVDTERQTAARKSNNYFVFPHRLKSGEIRTVEVHSYPVDDSGTLLFSIVHDITARVAAEAALRDQNEKLKRAENMARVGHWELHLDDDQAVFSASAREIIGISAEPLTGAALRDIILPEDRAKRDAALHNLIHYGQPYDVEFRVRRPNDGKIVDIHSIAAYDHDRNTVFGTFMDVTDYNQMVRVTRRQGSIIIATILVFLAASLVAVLLLLKGLRLQRQGENQLRQSTELVKERERQLRHLMDNLPGVVYRCRHDRDWTMLFVSNGVHELLGYTPADLLENRRLAFSDAILPEDREYVWRTWQEAVAARSAATLEYRVRSASGQIKWVREQGSGVYGENGELLFIEGLIIDITAQKEAEARLQYLTYHDPVTDLYNRTFVEEELRRLDTPQHMPFSLIMADVNGLKIVNDSLGHQQGDRLLQQAAGILKRTCRRDDIISRWGGDEFVIFLPHTSQPQARAICARIEAACAQETGGPVSISLAIGYATKDDPDLSIDAVLKQAEDNMYQRKMINKSSNKNAIVSSLQTALGEKSFETTHHARRLQELALALSKEKGLSRAEQDEVSLLALLHDIGKVGISESILNKPGALTSEERQIINKHPEIGFRIAAASPDLAAIANLILAHHERWDGTGYPNGLKGEEIPLAARIVAVADAFEAMTGDRPYRKAMSEDAALQEIAAGAGTQFDPELARLFVEMMKGEAST